MGRALARGIVVTPNAISEALERELVTYVCRVAAEPTCSKRARIDLYGDGAFNDGYGSGRRMGPIPEILLALGRQIGAPDPDAVTVSEYTPGQGVGAHIDRREAGPVIIGCALLADSVLRFCDRTGATCDVAYPRRGALRMADPMRSAPWTHELLPVASRRISIVFRRALPTAAW